MEEELIIEQKSLEWYKERLGNFTGSKVADLMVKSRTKGENFGKTAQTYIKKVASQRNLADEVLTDDNLFLEYLDLEDIHSKAISWGNEHEAIARGMFELETGITVEEKGSVKHPTIEHYASSPDGYFTEDGQAGILEIKCPIKGEIYLDYKSIQCGEDLKAINATYYWQMQAEIDCNDTQFGYFVAYYKFDKEPLHIAKIERNDEDIQTIHDRIALAEEYIYELNNK